MFGTELVSLVEVNQPNTGDISFVLPRGAGANIPIELFISPEAVACSTAYDGFQETEWASELHPSSQFVSALLESKKYLLYAGQVYFSFAPPQITTVTLWRESAERMYFVVFGSSFFMREAAKAVAQLDDTQQICQISSPEVDPFSDTRLVCALGFRSSFDLLITVQNQTSEPYSYTDYAQRPVIFRVRTTEELMIAYPTIGMDKGLRITGDGLRHDGFGEDRLQTIVLLVFNTSLLEEKSTLREKFTADPEFAALGIEYHEDHGYFGHAGDGSVIPTELPLEAPIGKPWLRFWCYPVSAQEAGSLDCDTPPGIGREIHVVAAWGSIWSDLSHTISYNLPSVSFVSRRTFPTEGGVLLLEGSNFGQGPWMRGSKLRLVDTDLTGPIFQELACSNKPTSFECKPLTSEAALSLKHNGTFSDEWGEVAEEELNEEELNYIQQWNSSAPYTWDDEAILCRIPPGTASHLEIHFKVADDDKPLLVLSQWEGQHFGFQEPVIHHMSPTVHATHGYIRHRGASNTEYFRSDLPLIPSLLTIEGRNLGRSGIVGLQSNGHPQLQICPVSEWTSTRVSCHVPPGSGWNVTVLLSNCGQMAVCQEATHLTVLESDHHPALVMSSIANWIPNATEAAIYDDAGEGVIPLTPKLGSCQIGYLPPVITRVSPSMGAAAGNEEYAVTITGLNFGPSPTAWQRQRLSVSGAFQSARPLTNIDIVTSADPLARHKSFRVQIRPGVGVGDEIVVRSGSTHESKPYKIAYNPPEIYSVEPFPLIGSASFLRLYLHGKNFGDSRIRDFSVKFREIQCSNVAKAAGAEDSIIICDLNIISLATSSLRIGNESVKVEVAGQLSLGSPPIEIVCGEGYWGFIGGFCQECPTGAFCPGGLQGPISLPGYWLESDFEVIPCTPPESCRGGRNRTHQIVRLGTVATSAIEQTGGIYHEDVDCWDLWDGCSEDDNGWSGLWPNATEVDEEDWNFNTTDSVNRFFPGAARFGAVVWGVPPEQIGVVSLEESPNSRFISQCSHAYTGDDCSKCNEGFYRPNGNSPVCKQCPDRAWVLVVLLLLFLMILAAIGLYLRKQQITINLLGLTIAIDFFQSLVMFAGFSFKWPPELLALLELGSLLTFDVQVTAVDCAIKLSYKQKWLLTQSAFLVYMGSYLLFSLVVMAVTWCRAWQKRRKLKSKRNAMMRRVDNPHQPKKLKLNRRIARQWDTIVAIGIFSMYLLYLMLARASLQVFDCSANEVGEQVLDAAPEIRCWVPNGDHMMLVPMAIASLVVYVVGIPFAFTVILWWRRRGIKADQHLLELGLGHARVANPHYNLRQRYSRLYMHFTVDCYFWRVVLLFRKLCLVLVGLFADGNSLLQVGYAGCPL